MQLRAWRSLKGLSRDAVAKQIGISEIAVLRHERGLRFPPGDTQERYREITEGAVTGQDWLDLWNDAESVSARAKDERAAKGKKKAAAA